MAHVKELLTAPQQAAVERAVADAEARTSAEIVLAMAGRCARYERAEDTVGLCLALLAVAAAWILWQDIGPDTRDWSAGATVALGLFPLLLIFTAWAVLGSIIARHVPALTRPFIPRPRMLEAVQRRGLESFHTFRVADSSASSGLLIFIALFERTVWIRGDHAISAKIPDEAWSPVRNRIVEGFKAGNPGAALPDAVRLAGDILAQHFPAGAVARNELKDEVRFVQ
jgi:putative membrane protein